MNPALLHDNIGFDAEKDFDPIRRDRLHPDGDLGTSLAPARSRCPNSSSSRAAGPTRSIVALPSVTAQLVLEMIRRQNVPLFSIKYKRFGRGDDRAAGQLCRC